MIQDIIKKKKKEQELAAKVESVKKEINVVQKDMNSEVKIEVRKEVPKVEPVKPIVSLQ